MSDALSASKSLRRDVLRIWGHACVYCGGRPDHMDHLVPWSRWGPTTVANLRPACTRCGSAKGALDPIEWLGERCPPELAEATRIEWAAVRLEHEPGSVRPPKAPPIAPPRRRGPGPPGPAIELVTWPLTPRRPPPRPGPGGPGGRTLRRSPPPQAAPAPGEQPARCNETAVAMQRDETGPKAEELR